MELDTADREHELKIKKICRFCLTQKVEKLGSIYTRDSRASAPLAMEIMAIASMEVFLNDGMPCFVCSDCRLFFEHSYRFKQMCKTADNLLRQYPLTGKWPEPLKIPYFPQTQQQKATARVISKPVIDNVTIINKMHTPKIKLLNSNPVATPEPPAPMRMIKVEKLDEDATTIFLNKVENDEELSIDDVQRLIAAADEEEFLTLEEEAPMTVKASPNKPKLLNKSSMRILNKEANMVVEPRLSKPQIQRDEDGNVAIVTEILDPNDPYEPELDPIKNAAPVETNVFPCPHCERSFPLRQLRDIHMVNHNRARYFRCTHCDKSFFSKYDLQKHNFIHSGERPYKCSVCVKAFTRAALLHRHEKTHTDIPKYLCIHCEKPFISREEMEKHTERHLKNRPFKCKVCQKSFAFKQGLERHEVIHSTEQPYPCQYCEQSFYTPGKLARHLTAHAGKRAYPCKFCSKSYLLSHHLTRHMRSHKQGTSPFTCYECHTIYKTYEALIQHSVEHAQEKLVCPLCKVNLENVDAVEDHMKAHSDSETYACEFCDLIFISSVQLSEHIDKEHADDMLPYQKDDENYMTDDATMQAEATMNEFINDDELTEPDEKPSYFKTLKIENSMKPEIISQVILSPSNTEQSKEATDDEVQTPKIRKVMIGNDIINVENISSHKKSTQELRRKQTKSKIMASAPVKAQIKMANNEMTPSKTSSSTSSLKNKETSIDNMLNSLPKGVSVRRSATKSTTVKDASPETPLKTITTKTNNHNINEKSASVEKRPRGRPRTSKIVAPKSPTSPSKSSPVAASKSTAGASKSSPAAASKSSPAAGSKSTAVASKSPATSTKSPIAATSRETVIMSGDKKVKIQRISITKKEADQMVKDGRLVMKNGNMVLKQSAAKQFKSSMNQ